MLLCKLHVFSTLEGNENGVALDIFHWTLTYNHSGNYRDIFNVMRHHFLLFLGSLKERERESEINETSTGNTITNAASGQPESNLTGHMLSNRR